MHVFQAHASLVKGRSMVEHSGTMHIVVFRKEARRRHPGDHVSKALFQLGSRRGSLRRARRAWADIVPQVGPNHVGPHRSPSLVSPLRLHCVVRHHIFLLPIVNTSGDERELPDVQHLVNIIVFRISRKIVSRPPAPRHLD